MITYTSIINDMYIGKSEYSALLDSLYNDFLVGENMPDATMSDLEDMELVLNVLLAQRELTKKAIYKNKLKTREEMAAAVAFLSKVTYLKEIFDIASGKLSLSEIRKAAKTLAPKMQSAFS